MRLLSLLLLLGQFKPSPGVDGKPISPSSITVPVASIGSLDAGTLGMGAGTWCFNNTGSVDCEPSMWLAGASNGGIYLNPSGTRHIFDNGTNLAVNSDLSTSGKFIGNGRNVPTAAPNDGGTPEVYIEYGRDVLSGTTKAVTFKNPFSEAPSCRCTDDTAIAACDVSATSTTAATFNGTSGDKFHWECSGAR